MSLVRETLLEQSITACAYMRSRSAGSVDRVSMVLRLYEEGFTKEIRMKLDFRQPSLSEEALRKKSECKHSVALS